MGNTSSQAFSEANEIINEVVHPHLGNIGVDKGSKERDCFVKIFHFADEMMGQQKLRRFNTRIKKFNSNQYILQIKQVQMVLKHQMCAHNCDIILYFQKFTQTLGTIINKRLKEKKNFIEKQIYIFINKVLEALIFLQDNGFKNCHLDKNSIVFCKDTVKLIDLGIATCSPYQQFLDSLEFIPGFYVAPEHLKDLKQRNYQPYLSPKSDIFCLGIITLQLACMEPLDSYYNYENFTLDYESLIHRVSKIVYSVQLKTLIASMLQFEPDLRIGLISLQQKVRKILNLETSEQQNICHKRTRSSSTKMLKQLLTNSRRTITGALNEHSSLARKSSQTSITSMASMNAKQSISKSQIQSKVRVRKQSEVLLSSFQPNTLKDLVKNKIQSQKINQNKQLFNKQNHTVQLNLVNDTSNTNSMEFQRHQIQNSKIIEQARRKSFGVKSFFDNSGDSVKKIYPTPKINDYLHKNHLFKKEPTIFPIIEETSYKGKGQQEVSEHKNTTFSNVPENSPITLPQFHQTNSINQQTLESNKKQQITQFNQRSQKQEQKKIQKKMQQESKLMQQKKKKSLDKMYKTTQSITSSENKQYKKCGDKNAFKKILLNDHFLYQGEIINEDVFEGSGVLYNPNGVIIYKGSWIANYYDGYGTEYNLQPNEMKVEMSNLNISSKNWIRYDGQFSKGSWQGFGMIHFVNGERFSGCMRNGQANGYGCFYDSNNQMTKNGIWVNNRLQS